MTPASNRAAACKLISKCEAFGWLLRRTLARLIEHMFPPPTATTRGANGGRSVAEQTSASSRRRFALIVAILSQADDRPAAYNSLFRAYRIFHESVFLIHLKSIALWFLSGCLFAFLDCRIVVVTGPSCFIA